MIAEQFSRFLLDLDGVMYLQDEPIEASVRAVGRLRGMDKSIRFLTNDPRPTREQIVERMDRIGVEASRSEIASSAWASAQYLRAEGAERVSTVGSQGLKTECERAGLTPTDHRPDAVLVGPTEKTDYEDILRAMRHLENGARFVATNPDTSYPTPDGLAPGSGALTEAVAAAANQRPVYVGKPYPRMFRAALEGELSPESVVMIGDNPDTDILGAHRAGIPAILLCRCGPPPAPRSRFHRPERVIASLEELFGEESGRLDWNHPGYDYPEELRVGVAGVVLDPEGRVWLTRAGGTASWGLPTGEIQPAETAPEALRRIVPHPVPGELRLTGLYSRPDTAADDEPARPVQTITCCFCARLQTRPSEETDAPGHFSPPGEFPGDLIPTHRSWIQTALKGDPRPEIQ